MWIILAFTSACLLGFYDVFKKKSLAGNAVLPVLMVNTVVCAAFFLPFILMSLCGNTQYVPLAGWHAHALVFLKAVIVLSSWVCGYYAMKHLPLTIVGPVNATRPVMTLFGALVIYGEQLNAWQWAGVSLALLSFFLLSRSGKKEGIRFSHNRWIFLLVLATVLGSASGLYDKFLMASVSEGGAGLDRFFVQGWYNLYQAVMMTAVILLIWFPHRHQVEHHLDFRVPHRRRHGLFLCPFMSWRHDCHRVDGAAWQCRRVVPLRRFAFPGEKPPFEIHRPPLRALGHDLPVRWQPMRLPLECRAGLSLYRVDGPG